MSYPAQPKNPWSAATIEPYLRQDIQASRDFLEAVLQIPRDPQSDRPALMVRTDELAVGHVVYVYWGENRGLVGVITGKKGNAIYVEPEKDSPFKNGGLFVAECLLRVLSEAPTFGSSEEAEEWLARSGEQEWFPGDLVRVSERRNREQAIQHGRVVKYLGIQGKEPPKYLVEIHGEPKIVPSYFIKGRA